MLYNRKDTKVNDAHPQTLLSKMKKGPKMSQHVKKFVLAHCDQMPQEVFCEDDGSPNDDNDTDDERMTPSKDERE